MVDLIVPMVRFFSMFSWISGVIFIIQGETITYTQELSILGIMEQQGGISACFLPLAKVFHKCLIHSEEGLPAAFYF